MKKTWVFGSVLVLAVLIVACAPQSQTTFPQQVTVFKSQSCGCCSLYVQYLEKSGFAVNVNEVQDMNGIKSELDIPLAMQSCHTTKVGDYFIEGHVPLEAIDQLLTEKPAISGIAMPGMPSGSPGMPGGKVGQFVIYGIGLDGSTSEFTRI